MNELPVDLVARTAPLMLIALVGVAGIVVWHMIPRRLVNTRLLVQIPFFGVMSAMLVIWRVAPTALPEAGANSAEATLFSLVKLLWWLHFAWTLIGIVRITLFIERRPREAHLLQDVVVGVVYAGLVLSILAFVFAVPVATLIATSGAVAVIFGLALQNTLSDVFSGIALELGRPFALGDWIVLSDGTEGRVVETNWRSTHLLGFPNNLIILPNSVLAKLGITNVSTPDETHALSITVRIAPTRAPAAVADVMRAALESADHIRRTPPPAVAIKAMDAAAIELDLIFRVSDVGLRLAARNEIHDLVHRHVRAAGLALAPPRATLIGLRDLPSSGSARLAPASPLELIAAHPSFACLAENEFEALSAATTIRRFRSGEAIVRDGEAPSPLMILRTGVVARLRGDDPGAEPVGHLAPGDIMGGIGLPYGAHITEVLKATCPVTAYEIDQEALASLLATRPELAEALAASCPTRSPAHVASGASGPGDAARFSLLKSVKSTLRV